MAWVRQVRTTSGATAVQIVESVGGRRRIVRHVGSAHDEASLGLLMSQARGLLDDHGQGMLDLGITCPVPKAKLLGPPVSPSLFPVEAKTGRPMVAPARVIKTTSALLYEVVGGVYDDLGFDQISDEVFKDLVVAQVVEPTSLLDVDRVLAELGRVSASLSTRNRTLTRAMSGAYRSQIARACFNHASTRGDISLVLYDVTSLRTQAAKEDDYRKVGFSKDRSIDPQIIVGLLVDREGFPLEIASFEGNMAEKNTITDVVDRFKARHGIEHLVVAADAGMLSARNLKALDDAGYQFIVGSRATKAPIDLESHFAWHGEFVTDGQIVDTVTPKIGMNTDNDPALAGEPIWDAKVFPKSWRAVWQYSAKRFAHDHHMLDLQQARVQAVINGDQVAHKPRFLKIVGGKPSLDQTALTRARKVCGLKGYVSNIDATVMPAGEVIAHYHDLWHVEQSFRITKSDLAARPFHARTREAIEAHLTIVFAALAVSRTIQKRTGMSIRRILRTTRPLRCATIAINGAIQTIPPALNNDQQALIHALKSNTPGH